MTNHPNKSKQQSNYCPTQTEQTTQIRQPKTNLTHPLTTTQTNSQLQSNKPTKTKQTKQPIRKTKQPASKQQNKTVKQTTQTQNQ